MKIICIDPKWFFETPDKCFIILNIDNFSNKCLSFINTLTHNHNFHSLIVSSSRLPDWGSLATELIRLSESALAAELTDDFLRSSLIFHPILKHNPNHLDHLHLLQNRKILLSFYCSSNL